MIETSKPGSEARGCLLGLVISLAFWALLGVGIYLALRLL